MSAIIEPPTAENRTLRKNCLSYSEVIAQSVGVIAPATVPAAVLGLVYASGGNGTWLSFLIGIVGLIFVCRNINQFARRSASPGSLYTYVVKGLGPTAGVVAGWSLLLGYIATGMSTLSGFVIFAEILLKPLGLHLPVLLLAIAGALIPGIIAYRDIRLSARMMLYLEALGILIILALGVAIWWRTGFAVDYEQFTLQGTTPGGVLLGVVLVMFAFSGFESSASLGAEAKDPLKTIPRSITHSVLITGFFFTFMAYVVVLGFRGTGANLGETEAPLALLAGTMNQGFIGYLINAGAAFSFFACTLACINSTSRIFFSMSQHGLLHDALGDAHETNKTPHIAVITATAITLIFPVALITLGFDFFAAQGYFGSLASFGFLSVYMLVSVAAPVYLRGLGKLRPSDVIFSVLAVGFMLLPILGTVGIPGSTLFPPPEFPDNIFIWIFAAYLLVGLAWLWIQRTRSPKLIHNLKSSVDEIHRSFEASNRPR